VAVRVPLILILLGVLLAGCDVTPSVKVGQVAPTLQTKTLADVGNDLSQITTYRYPDERMYQYSLDEAFRQGKPVVVEFATPGHCTVCDNQLQMLKGLLAKYDSDVIFLHMDQYKNPEAFKAFRVIGDPWTFVIDRQRVVQFKQAGRMLYGELDSAIARVLMQPAG